MEKAQEPEPMLALAKEFNISPAMKDIDESQALHFATFEEAREFLLTLEGKKGSIKDKQFEKLYREALPKHHGIVSVRK
jgi:hypothetical protein